MNATQRKLDTIIRKLEILQHDPRTDGLWQLENAKTLLIEALSELER